MNIPITVSQTDGRTFVIDWDENDPVTSHLNNWTQLDFLRAIRVGITEQTLEKLDDEL